MNLSPLNSKVVLDGSASRVLLALAYREGLLTESPNNDKCLEGLAARDYPSWLITQTLEQVVLFDQVHLPLRFAWKGVQGNLIESGPFYPIPEPEKPKSEVFAIAPAILNGIMKARGINPTPFEDPSILERLGNALKESQEWEKKYGETFPSGFDLLGKLVAHKELENKYVEAQAVQRRLGEFDPMYEALENYLEVLATAQDRAAFVMTPTYEAGSQQLFQPKIAKSETNPQTVLLRLTSARLGVIPYGQTLAQTLELARDPATVALRVKIQEWTDSLTADSGATTERIQNEISHALSILRKAGVGSTVSNITTYLGLPLALLTPVSTFVAEMGWVCTISGFIGLGISHATAKTYEWASFGSSNRV